jgi:bacillithiol biosynthesis deacetylase BshB1
MTCDLLVFSPHPDDAEIHCGATIAAHVRQGARVVLVDATRGEMASRGTPDERAKEAAAAAAILGLAARENLHLRDGHLVGDDLAARAEVVAAIRRHRPGAVLCIHGHARHGDHMALANLVAPAAKAAALHRFPVPGAAVAGVRLWFYEAELPLAAPALLVPATEADWQTKRAAILCYASQLHQPGKDGPATTIASPSFLGWIEARGRAWGMQAGADYAEAFAGPEAPRIPDLRRV